MTDDEIDTLHGNYRRARTKYIEINEEADKFSQNLGHIYRVISADGSSGSYSPSRQSLNEQQIATVKNFPTPEAILHMMDCWVIARDELKAAYNALPDNEHSNCAPLPKDVRP